MAKEYIEREAAKRIIDDINTWSSGWREYAKLQMESLPAADVAPVVRCKDCRYAYDSVGGWCCSHGVCVDCVVRENFFCADGARMDGDGE